MQNTNGKQRVLIDLGRFRQKEIRNLHRKGRGKVIDRVDDALADLIQDGVVSSTAPAVIVVVKEKRRRTRFGGMSRLGLFGF